MRKMKFECKTCNTTFYIDQETIKDLAKQELSIYCPRCQLCVVRGSKLRKMFENKGGDPDGVY